MSHANTIQTVPGSAAILPFAQARRPVPATASSQGPARDASGFAVFAEGELGAAHVMAHEMLDSGRVDLGRLRLGTWLDAQSGSGSDWVHLQFHMAVFELASGDWHAAHRRFLGEVLPVAARTEHALTDAPALLWRLALAAPEAVCLPWQPLRRTALARLRRPSDPFVELHNLLALAGAGDVEALEHWLGGPARDAATRTARRVRSMGQALAAYARGAYGQAAATLHAVVPGLPSVGGSRAQNELFRQLEDHCRRLARGDGGRPAVAQAA